MKKLWRSDKSFSKFTQGVNDRIQTYVYLIPYILLLQCVLWYIHFYNISCLMFYNHQNFEIKIETWYHASTHMHTYVHTQNQWEDIWVSSIRKTICLFEPVLIRGGSLWNTESSNYLKNSWREKSFGSKAGPCPVCLVFWQAASPC